jgi:perosamine synthetase
MEQVDKILNRKRQIAGIYQDGIASKKLPMRLLGEQPGCTSGFWLPTVFLDSSIDRDKLMRRLKEVHGIETRPTFYPVHTMPMYAEEGSGKYPVAEKLSATGMNLPGYPALTDDQILYIIDALEKEVK